MNHPRYEKIKLSCSCFQCTWKERLRKWETLEQFKQKCKSISYYINNPEEVELDYVKYKRKADEHIVYWYRRNVRRDHAKRVRLTYRRNLKNLNDDLVKIGMEYTD